MSNTYNYQNQAMLGKFNSAESDQLEILIQKNKNRVPRTPAFWPNEVKIARQKIKEKVHGQPSKFNAQFWLQDSLLQAPNQQKFAPMKITFWNRDQQRTPNYFRKVRVLGKEQDEKVPWNTNRERPLGAPRFDCLATHIGHAVGFKFIRFWEDVVHRAATPIEKDHWKNFKKWSGKNLVDNELASAQGLKNSGLESPPASPNLGDAVERERAKRKQLAAAERQQKDKKCKLTLNEHKDPDPFGFWYMNPSSK